MFAQTPVLQQSKWLRFATLCLLYVAQGLPIGLFQVALPAWFSAQGLSLAEVGGFIAIVFLPWSFKLFAGPIMDRFSFPAMGRRRPWVLLAQSGIVLTCLVLALVAPDPTQSYYLLAGIGFIANLFGAVQDVAVDGMAIDILEEDERAQANAYMFGGQVAGISIAGAGGSLALMNFGLTVAGLLMALTVFLIMLLPLCLRERPGERLLPWTAGEPSKEALESVNDSWRDIVVSLVRAIVLPMSLLLIVVEGLQRMAGGMLNAIAPVLVVQDLGWFQTEYTNWTATAGIVGAVVGVLFGAMVDRAGAFRVMAVAIALRLILFLAFALLEPYWQNKEFVMAMILLAALTGQFVTITVIALFMRLCLPPISATQFAVYMASANLTLSMGSSLVAPLSGWLDYSEMFLFMAGLHVVFLLLIPFLNFERHAHDNNALLISLGKADTLPG